MTGRERIRLDTPAPPADAGRSDAIRDRALRAARTARREPQRAPARRGHLSAVPSRPEVTR